MVSSQPAVSVLGKGHTDTHAQTKSYSQTCSGHVTQVKPKVHLVHICFWNPSLMTNSEARHKVAHSTVSYTKQPIVCLTNFAQGGNTSVEVNGLCSQVFHRGVSQRSHYSFDPGGSAQ